MYEVNTKGYLVDEQGFPANKRELELVLDACEQTLKLGDLGRVALARRICESRYPEMAQQLDFNTFA